jgi:hypothetical protein
MSPQFGGASYHHCQHLPPLRRVNLRSPWSSPKITKKWYYEATFTADLKLPQVSSVIDHLQVSIGIYLKSIERAGSHGQFASTCMALRPVRRSSVFRSSNSATVIL